MKKAITFNLQRVNSIIKDYEALKQLIYKTCHIINENDKRAFPGSLALDTLDINKIADNKVILSNYNDTFGYSYYSFPITYLALDKNALIEQIKIDVAKRAEEEKRQEQEYKEAAAAKSAEQEYKRYLELEAKYGKRKEQQ